MIPLPGANGLEVVPSAVIVTSPAPAGLKITVLFGVDGPTTTWALACPVAPSWSVTITVAVNTPPLIETNERVWPVPDA